METAGFSETPINSTKINDVTTQHTVIFVVTGVRTSNPTMPVPFAKNNVANVYVSLNNSLPQFVCFLTLKLEISSEESILQIESTTAYLNCLCFASYANYIKQQTQFSSQKSKVAHSPHQQTSNYLSIALASNKKSIF